MIEVSARPVGRVLAALLCVAMLGAFAPKGPRPAPGAPVVPLALEQLRQPRHLPYDENATPAQVNARLDAAFAKAKAEDKRVLVEFGGAWCVWCVILTAVTDLPQVAPYIEDNFVMVSVFVDSSGFSDRDLRTLKRFKLKNADGFPWMIVAEPDGRVLSSSSEITDDNHQSPQAMVNWLARWAKRPARK